MLKCRICGEEKPETEFFKIKHFYRVMKSKRQWCRDCMRMYIEMKKDKEQQELLVNKKWEFCVSFI